MNGDRLAAIELCDCECHDGENFDTPFRWRVVPLTGPGRDLCTDCLLTLITEHVGKPLAITRFR